MSKLKPIHPGEILREEFLIPMDIEPSRLANDTKISEEEINALIEETRPITPNAALRLSLYFGLSERFWLNLQSRYDLETEKDNLADRLQREVRILATA
jgi:addiction module HigA family antidote